MKLLLLFVFAQNPIGASLSTPNEQTDFLPGVKAISEGDEMYPVRVYEEFRGNKLSLRLWDLPLKNRFNEIGQKPPLQLRVTFGHDDTDERIVLGTLREAHGLFEAGWHPIASTTRDMLARNDLDEMLTILNFMELATPSRESHLKGFTFENIDVNRIHAHWHSPRNFNECHKCDTDDCGEHDILTCCEGRNYQEQAQFHFDYNYQQNDEEARAEFGLGGKVKCKGEVQTLKLLCPTQGESRRNPGNNYYTSEMVKIIGWGDINHDGVEDILATSHSWTDGTASFHYIFAFTCLEKDGPLLILPNAWE